MTIILFSVCSLYSAIVLSEKYHKYLSSMHTTIPLFVCVCVISSVGYFKIGSGKCLDKVMTPYKTISYTMMVLDTTLT
jgi:hypothetical protein